jgi:hypothetical protein
LNRHYNKIGFQGKKKAKNDKYFEGWYYKQVKKDDSYIISFIPGISYNKIDPHSFIQCIIRNEKNELNSHYFKYKINDFISNEDPFEVKIGKSIFSEKSIYLDLKNDDITIKGKLDFANIEELEKSILSPNIMGYFSYIPKMECNHHIVSMNHQVFGTIIVNDKEIDLNNGFGYIEKDWGISFPKEYIWLQCNHFDTHTVKLALSIATIPFLGFSFKGFFCSLIIDSKEYRFATYNNSKLRIHSLEEGYLNITFIKGKIEVEIIAEVEKVLPLASPKNGVMKNFIKEGLAGIISIRFKNNKTGEIIEAKGKNAGIEIMMKK